MRLLSLLAMISVAIQISGEAVGQSAPTSEIAPNGKLRMALIGSNPILVTRRPDGSVGGISADIGRLIAERLHVAFDPVIYLDADVYAKSFGTGQWDVAIGPRTPAAETHSDFSPDFMIVDNIFVAAPGRKFADASQVDRRGIKVAVVQNGEADQFLSRTLKSAELLRISGGSDAIIEALRSGKADVYGANAENVRPVVNGLPDTKIVPGAFSSVRMAVAFPKDRSIAARRTLAEIVDEEAKATGLVQKAIDQAGLTGVRVAPNCEPLSQRVGREVGCYIIAHEVLGELPQRPIYWHLDAYPTRAEAEAAKGPRGTVVESLGKVWLFTIAEAGWQGPRGERVAEIGPLPVSLGAKYSARYMEAIFRPGMKTEPHRHPGPEAWYTLAGETCLETSEGMTVGRAGGAHVIVPSGLPMELTATGTELRRALVLILHDSSQPAGSPAYDWRPKGLCK